MPDPSDRSEEPEVTLPVDRTAEVMRYYFPLLEPESPEKALERSRRRAAEERRHQETVLRRQSELFSTYEEVIILANVFYAWASRHVVETGLIRVNEYGAGYTEQIRGGWREGWKMQTRRVRGPLINVTAYWRLLDVPGEFYAHYRNYDYIDDSGDTREGFVTEQRQKHDLTLDIMQADGSLWWMGKPLARENVSEEFNPYHTRYVVHAIRDIVRKSGVTEWP